MAYEIVKHSGREFARWIPDGATKITHKQGRGVVYVYHKTAGAIASIVAVGYAGSAAKAAFHYRYRTMDEVSRKVKSFFDGLDQHYARVAKSRQSSNSGHSFKAGDIVTNSWGYDQTNVDWYRVERASTCFVWLQPIAADVEQTGFMSGHSAPAIDTTANDPQQWSFTDKSSPLEKHKASGDNVCFDHGSGSKWDGRALYTSWYH